MRPIIQSKKHIFQIAQGTTAQAVTSSFVAIDAIEGAPSQPQHISEGAIVKACYVEMWVNQDSTSVTGSYQFVIAKDPGGNAGMTSGQMAALHDYDNKKNILFTAQGLLGPDDSGIVPIVRGWYKIPKGKQRFGLGDILRISLRNSNLTAVDINHCGLVIFKEYT